MSDFTAVFSVDSAYYKRQNFTDGIQLLALDKRVWNHFEFFGVYRRLYIQKRNYADIFTACDVPGVFCDIQQVFKENASPNYG